MTLPAPYPSDTRAKGWRFEIDYEKVEQSDTWSLAAEVPMAQHGLLMMWLVSWTQVPCGSFPNDESLIRAKCRIAPKYWAPMREILMRGWWLADDGRLYHDTIVSRVAEMIEYRRKNAKRVADFKAAKREQRGGNALPPSDHDDSNDTGTGTSSSLRSEDISSGSTESKYPAEFDAVWQAYPDRPGRSKADACKAWKARRKEGVTAEALMAGVERYAAYCRACKTEPGFIKQPTTFFGPGEHYLNAWTAPAPATPGTRPAFGSNKFAAAAASIFDTPQNQGEVIDV
uniref:DUF1376 domain-containing protein n=1 Tax=Variovorax paradoxus (strain S110) TaxID=543728 RepID=C5CJN0_VARPS